MLTVYGVTFDHTYNYGSCFQAYALQTSIEKIKINGEPCTYYLIPTRKLKGYPKTGVMHIAGRLISSYWHLKFLGFERKMKYVPIKRKDELYGNTGTEADAYVCGSDVIWNTDQNRKISAYYLDFSKKYKFSYAASFGKTSIDEKTLTRIGEYISKLDQISVREESSKEIAERISGKEVAVVADPVLLLKKEEWSSVASRARNNRGFIFVYTTHINKELEDFLQKLVELTDLRVVRSAWSISTKTVLKQGVINALKPEDWLNCIQNADYVITNSFHATAFSVLFHKKFFTVVHGEKEQGINVRMNDFLNSIGLSERLFSEVPEEIDLNEIDYTAADVSVNALREKSIAFLKNNLESAYKKKI